MKISVIILNWNGKVDTLNCLASLQKVTTPHEVLVVDNGSIDGSAEAIEEQFPELQLVRTGKNLGYAEGNNVGIRAALKQGFDYLLILNNDTLVDPNILNAFLERDVPIQGGKPLLMSNSSVLDHLGGNWNPEKGVFDLVGAGASETEWNTPLILDYVCGVALFVKREVFEKVGLFDPRFFLFWEESDWCLRAKRAGYLSYSCPEALLYHKVSGSFSGGKPHTTYFWWRNRLLWIEKNCSPYEQKSLKRKIRRDFFHILKLYCFRSLFSRKNSLRLKTYRAQLAGIKDYHLRNFGNAPSWLLQK